MGEIEEMPIGNNCGNDTNICTCEFSENLQKMDVVQGIKKHAQNGT